MLWKFRKQNVQSIRKTIFKICFEKKNLYDKLKQAHISYEAKTARDLLVAIGPVGTFVAIGTLVAIGTFVAIGSFVAIGTYVAIGTFVAIRKLLPLELLLS